MPDRSSLTALPPRRRICFVTADLVGPIRNGGIGTAVANPELAVAHDVFRWLLDRRFDIVHFHEWRGHGFVALQAKRAGIAFVDMLLCVTAHGPSIWHRAHNAELAQSIDRLETDFMERRSAALADRLFSPSRYLLRAEGWAMPAAVEIRGNVLPSGTEPARGAAPIAATEIVLFGRLEMLKGIELFCEAVEKADLAGAVPITFLGKAGVIHGRPAPPRGGDERHPAGTTGKRRRGAARRLVRLAQGGGGPLLLIAVCVTHRERPKLLCRADETPCVRRHRICASLRAALDWCYGNPHLLCRHPPRRRPLRCRMPGNRHCEPGAQHRGDLGEP